MNSNTKYSIIMVCLNAGERIEKTLASVLSQTETDYEVIIKDGCSTDGSLEHLLERVTTRHAFPLTMQEIQEKVTMITCKDTGIYDAMNQAIAHAQGEYLLFLNAGDDLYQDTTLAEVSKALAHKNADIVYGNLYHKSLDTMIYAAPAINDFTCYRNVPCHQTCFYKKQLFETRGYDANYTVRADYEHFLWCYYEAKANIVYVPVVVAAYEGGGYSETAENRRNSAKQHREIVVQYMGKKKANHYRNIMWLTLAPLRSKIAESEKLSGVYNRVKTLIYRVRKGKNA